MHPKRESALGPLRPALLVTSPIPSDLFLRTRCRLSQPSLDWDLAPKTVVAGRGGCRYALTSLCVKLD